MWLFMRKCESVIQVTADYISWVMSFYWTSGLLLLLWICSWNSLSIQSWPFSYPSLSPHGVFLHKSPKGKSLEDCHGGKNEDVFEIAKITCENQETSWLHNMTAKTNAFQKPF